MKPHEAANITRGLRKGLAGSIRTALAMAADALEAPVDGRKWISVETSPEKNGFCQCVIKPIGGGKPYVADRTYDLDLGRWSADDVLFYLPHTTPPIPEMPKYEWSPPTTPRDAVVTWEGTPGLTSRATVRAWSVDVVWCQYEDYELTRYGLEDQKLRRITSIELPKPVIDERLVDFVRGARGLGARGLFSSRVVAGDRDLYEIPRDAAQATLRLLRAAEEAIPAETGK